MNNNLLIPESIRSAVKAANDHDGQEYHGIEAIRKWSDEKLIGADVTFVITDIKSSGDQTVVTAEVDGDFDKTGLPDPFVMALHFVTVSPLKVNVYSLEGVVCSG